MKKIIFLFSLLLIVFSVKGQNLVPNGDFEGYSSCPTSWDQLDSCEYWFNPSTGGIYGSPNYFNQCDSINMAGVPRNFAGFQQAHSGAGYAGIALWSYQQSDYREYIEVPLISPLIANQCYHFELYANLANNYRYTTDAVGIYFSDTAIAGIPNFNPLPFTPQISNSTGFFTDTLNWILVSGNYTAVGGEDYLIIGNFKGDVNTTSIIINSSNTYLYAYVYIDDVSLTETLCTGINENINNASIHISQNPVSDNLQISGTIQSSEAEINLTDVTGRICFHKTIFSKGNFGVNVNVNDFSDGIYILNVRDGGKLFSKKVVVKK